MMGTESLYMIGTESVYMMGMSYSMMGAVPVLNREKIGTVQYNT